MADDVRQPSLLDEEAQPVPFQLTAKARRVVAPATLPDLAVLPGGRHRGPVGRALVPIDGVDDDTDDTDPRPAQARALYRAGHGVRAIATRLDVHPRAVADWVDAVDRRAIAHHEDVPVDPSTQEAPPTAWVTGHAAGMASDHAFADPSFVQGATLVVALAETSNWAVVLRGTDVEVLARALAWLREHTDVDDRNVRVHVRVAPGASIDLATADLDDRLGIDAGQLTRARWHDGSHGALLDVRVRIAQPGLAGRIAAWRERVLGATPFADRPETHAS